MTSKSGKRYDSREILKLQKQIQRWLSEAAKIEVLGPLENRR